MRPHLLPLAIALTPLLAPTPRASAAPPPQSGGTHQDERFGYKIRYPRGWRQIPQQVGEQWQIAKYQSDKLYVYNEKETGWSWEHRPEMVVIAFVEQPEEEEGEKKEAEEDEDGNRIIRLSNPYKDYEEYLDGTFSGGGWYVSEKKESKVGGTPVTRIEVKVEKLTRRGPMRLITWVYHCPGVDLAVQFDVLEKHYSKLRKTVSTSHKSFKQIPRTEGALPTEQTGGGRFRITLINEEKLSPDERRDRRFRSEQQYREKVAASVPDDWRVEEHGRFLVLNHHDKKGAKYVVEQAEAVFEFLEDTFDYVGPNEYVRAPVFRICKDEQEESAFRGPTGWFGMGLEICTNRQELGWSTWLNSRLLDIWFQDRDRDLYWSMPTWLKTGLDELICNSRAKGKKLNFYADTWDVDDLRLALRNEELPSLKDLFTMTQEDAWETLDRYNDLKGYSVYSAVRAQDAALVRYLLVGKGSKDKKYKDLVKEYLRNLAAVIAEEEARSKTEAKESVDEAPKTEEEEDAWFRNRRSNLQEKRKVILEDVYFRTFSDWTDKDWEKFDKAFQKEIG